MKVKELIAELNKCKQEDEIILSSDEEGNSFSTLDAKSIDSDYAKNSVVLFPWHEGVELEFIK